MAANWPIELLVIEAGEAFNLIHERQVHQHTSWFRCLRVCLCVCVCVSLVKGSSGRLFPGRIQTNARDQFYHC